MALRVTILLAKGYTVSDIAKYISVTEKSIYAYATKIRYKLNLASLVQLCFYLEKEFDAENPALCLPE
nr:LuxR C-terminal-related transcriptional regulator [Intestinirhabdus alba]